MTTRFGLTVTVILFIVVMAVLHWEDNFSDPFRPHEVAKSDKGAIFEAQKVLKDSNLTMLRLDFSTEKEERYSLCYHSKGFFGPATISLTSFGHNMRDFKKVRKQIIRIFRQGNIKTELRRMNDWVSNFQQTIVLRDYFPEQLVYLVDYFGKYFYSLEVVNWSINVPGQEKTGTFSYFFKYGVK